MINKRINFLLKNYLTNIILIWAAILFYKYNNFYSNFLTQETQTIIFYLALTYTIIGLFIYIIIPIETRETKGKLIFRSFKKISLSFYHIFKRFTSNIKTPLPKLDHKEKTAFLFIIVKIFFLPLMINFMINNYHAVNFQISDVLKAPLSILSFNNIIYPFLIAVLFFIDTLYFSFGYSVELKSLNNTVRSVEPTIFGWLVALICYPPFNGMVSDYVSWYANDMATFSTSIITFIMRILIIVLLIIYVGASVSLGAKCSNLTNRGIVTRGTYSIVRHPAYIAKVSAWWLMIIPVFSLVAFGSMLLWTGIYFMRAITEERHLSKDPDYIKYRNKVRWRFIPYIY